MDAELLQEGALRSTFEDILRLRQEMGQYDEADQEGEGDGVGPMHMTEEDVNAHMLLNMLQSHAEGLGMPHGPAHAMLAQLGIHLPRPPPMHEK
ncbi:hypothetical protein EON65_45010 [archaeon]|nr:MAG: hypothetical protein EON65_45010 [archaeon]